MRARAGVSLRGGRGRDAAHALCSPCVEVRDLRWLHYSWTRRHFQEVLASLNTHSLAHIL